jgi:hypothetical protein
MMKACTRRGLLALALGALVSTLLPAQPVPVTVPPRSVSAPPSGAGADAGRRADADDKLLHFLAGLAAGLSAGGAAYALAPEAECWRYPSSVSLVGLAAGALAGGAKETLDARQRQAGSRVEASDFFHTLLGGLAGGVLAEALIRSGRAVNADPRSTGIVLVLCGGALGFGVLRSAYY